ncbi:MAG: MFS transporter [Candidatus Binatia bacterium]|jgi:MFS family permease|nr:MFS transporter [Candidatus Binatia bacterium]
METGIKKRRLSTNPWFVAGIGSLIYGFGRGIHTSFGVIYVALLETFSWNRGITAGIYSLNLIVDAIASPIVGHLIDRYGPEKIVGLGCLLLATGLLLSSRISSLWDFYIYFGLISALGFSFMGMVPHVVLVSQWFSTRRAVAIGIVFSATGIGMMLWGPAIQGLISTWDLSWALRALGIFALIFVMPLALIFYRRGPFYEAQHRGPSDLQSQWTARLALRSIQFWSLFLARVLASSGVLVILTHQVAHVVDIGYSRIFAATVFGMMGIMSTFGRILFGYVADLFSKPSVYTLNTAISLVGVFALMAARDLTRPWLLYLYLFCFGMGFGSRAVIFSALSADIFSGRGFGAIYGFFAVSVGVGGALGSSLGGVLHDITGSYFISFQYSAVALSLSALCIWLPSLEWVRSFDQRLQPREDV